MPLATHNSRKYGKSGIRERIRYRNDACAFLLCESSTTFLVNAKLRTPSCTKRNTAAEPDPREHARVARFADASCPTRRDAALLVRNFDRNTYGASRRPNSSYYGRYNSARLYSRYPLGLDLNP
jgi:hypothetical protein